MSRKLDPTESDTLRARAREEISMASIAEAACASRPAEARLLVAIADPANLGMPVRKICDIAGIHHDTYYRLMPQPDFDLRRREAMREALGDLAPALAALKKSAEDASAENKNGPADRRLLFQLAGFADRKEVKIEGSVETHLQVSDAQLLSIYLRLGIAIDKWVPAIRQAYEDGRLVAKALGEGNDDA
jgi:hypothetical protein